MLDFSSITGGISHGRIVTPAVVRNLIESGDYIHFLRSGVNPELESCADLIEEVCKASARPKHIRMILPSILNPDLAFRARQAGRAPDQVIKKLDHWHETLAKLKLRLEPKDTLEIRTTMEAHRYYAIFSDSQMIFGPCLHCEASLTTSSFFVGPEASATIATFHKDFDTLFRDKCTPYRLGDNERRRKQAAATTIEEEALLALGGHLPRAMKILLYVVSAFPVAGGGGATKEHLHAKFGWDPGDSNKRLREMELAGLLARAGDRSAGDNCCGRIASAWGISMARKYGSYRFDD
jgi:hypothetical protein